ncbi:MAG: hypothetical protein ACKVWR_11730 [Acidimicrobiales bacterium]
MANTDTMTELSAAAAGAPTKFDPNALISAVAGVVSIVLVWPIGLLSVVAGVVALFFGTRARDRIDEVERRLTGAGVANIGLILGLVGSVLGVASFFFHK